MTGKTVPRGRAKRTRADELTVLTLEDDGRRIAGKRMRRGRDLFDKFNMGSRFQMREREFSADLLRSMRRDKLRCLCSGEPADDDPKAWVARKSGVTLLDVPRSWMVVDVDTYSPDDLLLPIGDAEAAARDIADWLDLRGVELVWHATSSHGLKIRKRKDEDEPTLRVGLRFFVRLRQPLDMKGQKRLAKKLWGDKVDLSVYSPEHVIYTYDPELPGMRDPVRGERVGEFDGEPLDVDEPGDERAHDRGDDSKERDEDATLEAIREEGLYRENMGDGKHWIECPFSDEHTSDSKRGDAVYLEGGMNGHVFPSFKCLHGHCAHRRVEDLREKLGVKVTEKNYPRFAYIHLRKLFWDEDHHELIDSDVFDTYNAVGSQKAKPSAAFFASKRTLKFDDYDFAPSQPQSFMRRNRRYLNTYADLRIEPDDSVDVSIWTEHVEWLIPNREDREHVIDWLAHNYQRPGVKITWSPLLYGVSGTGKTTLFTALAKCIGPEYVSEPTQAELEDKFNGWAYRKLLAKIEELMSGAKFSVSEKLKPIIANETISIRDMHKASFVANNTCNVCASTNHMQAIPIERSDRRWMLVQCVEAPPNVREPKIKALWRWIEKNGFGGIAHWLASRDLRGFVAKGEAPMTALKDAVADASMTDLERGVDLCSIFNGYRVLTSGIVSDVLNENRINLHPNRIFLIAKRLEWLTLPDKQGRTTVGREKVTVWSPAGDEQAIRDFIRLTPQQRTDRAHKLAADAFDENKARRAKLKAVKGDLRE